MSSKIRIVVKDDRSANSVKGALRLFASGFAPDLFNRLGSYISDSAVYAKVVLLATSAVSATGTIGPVSGDVAGDTVTIGGVTLTASNSLQDNTHWKIGASDTISTANLATTINTNPTIASMVSATATGTSIALTIRIPGFIGNYVTLATTGGHTPVSGATTTGGTEDTPTNKFYLGQ